MSNDKFKPITLDRSNDLPGVLDLLSLDEDLLLDPVFNKFFLKDASVAKKSALLDLIELLARKKDDIKTPIFVEDLVPLLSSDIDLIAHNATCFVTKNMFRYSEGDRKILARALIDHSLKHKNHWVRHTFWWFSSHKDKPGYHDKTGTIIDVVEEITESDMKVIHSLADSFSLIPIESITMFRGFAVDESIIKRRKLRLDIMNNEKEMIDQLFSSQPLTRIGAVMTLRDKLRNDDKTEQ